MVHDGIQRLYFKYYFQIEKCKWKFNLFHRSINNFSLLSQKTSFPLSAYGSNQITLPSAIQIVIKKTNELEKQKKTSSPPSNQRLFKQKLLSGNAFVYVKILQFLEFF